MNFRGRRTILKELRQSVLNGAPHSLTFAPTGNMTGEQKQILQTYLNENFKLWTETWLLPKIEELAAKKS